MHDGQLLSPYSHSACENRSKTPTHFPLAQPLHISVIINTVFLDEKPLKKICTA